MKTSRKIDLIIDGLNLAKFLEKNTSKNLMKEISLYITNMCKFAFKVSKLYVNKILVIGGVDVHIYQLEKELMDLEKKLSELQKRKNDIPLWNFPERSRINEELKELENKKYEIQKQLEKKIPYTSSFWKNLEKEVEPVLKGNNVYIEGIKFLEVSLKRKRLDKEEKIERDDDIALASIIGFWYGQGKNFAVYSNDIRLLEVSIRSVNRLNGSNHIEIIIFTWHKHVADNISKRLHVKAFSIGEPTMDIETIKI